MPLWLHTQACYPSFEEAGVDWGRDQAIWDAYKYVQALKGKQIRGFAWLSRPNGYRIKINERDTSAAFQVFGEWAALQIANIGIRAPVFVPIPSSTCIAFGDDEKGMRLAEAVALRVENATVAPILRWRELRQRAADGGDRDPERLIQNLDIDNSAIPDDVVLIDDVASRGGHVRACARGLRAHGFRVEHAICAAQTENVLPERGMFGAQLRDLEAAPPALEWMLG